MKKFFTLLLTVLTAFSFTSKAQTVVCNADFNFSISGFTVQFTPVMLGDSINTTHYWNFGDGHIVSATNTTHVYAAAGTYNVKHYIIKHTPNGAIACSDSVTKAITIPPTNVCTLQAYFTWHADSLSWNTIHFQNQSIPNEPGDSIRWNFGDGSPVINGLVSTTATPTHVYANAGTYNVCIRVKKNNNTSGTPCVSEICKTVIVSQPCNLVANFSWTTSATNPLTVAFQNLTTPVSTADSIRWTFGDGSVSYAYSPTHTYATGGTYTVCLRVKRNGNAAGTVPCISEICKTVVVQAPCNVPASFTMHRDSINIRKVYFTNTTIAPTSTATAIWHFGDGTSATTWNAVHEYAQAGSYRVCLTVYFSATCYKETCDSVIIPNPPPSCQDISKFTYQKSTADAQKYTFTPDYIATNIIYTWTFGDGTGSHDPVSVHRYAQAGLYTACLTAWRGPNCASTTCKEIRVLPQINCDSIHVSYSYQRDPFIPNKVYFYATANFPILDETWTITRIPATSTPPVILHQNNPIYVFTDTGYYNVCLHAITLGGCVKEYCSVIHIEHVATNVCELQATPNPATSVVNVNVVLTQAGMIDAYVYSSTNVLVKEKHQQGTVGNNIVSININDLIAGLYTIKFMYNGKICYARFTKL